MQDYSFSPDLLSGESLEEAVVEREGGGGDRDQ